MKAMIVIIVFGDDLFYNDSYNRVGHFNIYIYIIYITN